MSTNTRIDDIVRVLKVSSEKFGPTTITKISEKRDSGCQAFKRFRRDVNHDCMCLTDR